MSSTYSGAVKLSIFGESHSNSIGMVLDNIPAGEPIDSQKLADFMARRTAKKDDKTSTSRTEADLVEFVSGIYEGKTTGTPICGIIKNTNVRSQDYKDVSNLVRPGHADYTGKLRYQGFNDFRGGGHFSGRLTASITIAGAICGQILERRGIYTSAHIYSILDVTDNSFNTISITREEILALRDKKMPVIDDAKGQKMVEVIENARLNQNSVGGVIECVTIGLPAGIGSPMFGGIENEIAKLMFGIPAVKGLEFGAGFHSTKMFGSQNNDDFFVDENGKIGTKTNNHGGILGGISSGMPISLKVAFKPTPSISSPQNTVDLSTMTNQTIEVKGRHDPCVVIRAVPVVESVVNIAILGQLIEANAL
jgi:chorismate synthase